MRRLFLLSIFACWLFPASAAAGPELDPVTRAALGRLPFDVALVGAIDVGSAALSPAGKRLLAALEREGGLRRATAELRRAAIDVGAPRERPSESLIPKRPGVPRWGKIDRVWLALPPSAFAGGDQYAFLAELDTDPARFIARLRKRGGQRLAERRFGAITYYALGDAAWAFVGPRHLVVAHVGYIEEVLRAATGQAHSAATNRALVAAVLAAGRPPGAHAWLAALVPDTARADLRRDPQTSALADVRWTAGHVTLSGETRWRAEVKVSRVAGAAPLAAALRQMIAAAEPDLTRAGLAAAMAATTVSAERDVALLEGSLPVPARARPAVMR
jgi:hypothetical protein